jgi:hypothetical protein
VHGRWQFGADAHAVLALNGAFRIHISLIGRVYVARMRTLFTLGLLLAATVSRPQSGSADAAGPMPVIELDPVLLVDTVRLDSGNNNKHYRLQLRNTGHAPLVISSVRSSDPCFCDRWPREPVLAGSSATLDVVCPPMWPGVKQQTHIIESNAAEPVFFKVKRVGVGQPPPSLER